MAADDLGPYPGYGLECGEKKKSTTWKPLALKELGGCEKSRSFLREFACFFACSDDLDAVDGGGHSVGDPLARGR